MTTMNGVRVMLYEVGNGLREFRFGQFFALFADLAKGYYWATRCVEYFEGTDFPELQYKQMILDRDDDQEIAILEVDSLVHFVKWVSPYWDEYYALKKPIAASAMIAFHNADLPPECPLLIRGIDAARYHVFAEDSNILERIKQAYPQGVYDCTLENEFQ